MVGAGGEGEDGTVTFGGGGVLGITSVGGGSLPARESGLPVSGANGADRMEPSTKQKVNVSSNVRLQAGQLFITLSCFARKNQTASRCRLKGNLRWDA
jgi:hypothetical protein